MLILLLALADLASPLASNGCPAGADFEKDGYVVQTVRVNEPLNVLRKFEPGAGMPPEIAAQEHQPLRYPDVRTGIGVLESRRFMPDFPGQRIAIFFAVATVSGCDIETRSLNLTYTILSTQTAPVLSGTPESRRRELQSPAETAGVVASRRFQVVPELHYDSAIRLSAGSRMEAHTGWSLFDSVQAEVSGSGNSRQLSAALTGSRDVVSHWFAHEDWQGAYAWSDTPAGGGHLRGGRLALHASATSRTLENGALALRFGGQIEGGNAQTEIPRVTLPPNTMASAHYGSVKLYAGTISRWRRSMLAASWGLELGSSNPSHGIDWRRNVIDVSNDTWWTAGDHHTIDLESRFAAGLLGSSGSVPLGKRFFAGSEAQRFTTGEDWQIRDSPLIRSLPANRFFMTTAGAGASSFFSVNLTAAATAWRTPIVPSVISKDPAFKRLLENQLVTATSALQNDFVSRDPHLVAVARSLSDVQTSLNRLKAEIRRTTGDFHVCRNSIGAAEFIALLPAMDAKGMQLYGLVRSLLPEDAQSDLIGGVIAACQPFGAEVRRLSTLRSEMSREFQKIDQKSARRKAEAEIAFPRRTLHTILNELNIWSVSPVAVFDAGRLGPAAGDLGGMRYGIGGGLRLTVVSAVSLTAGYAVNPDPHPGEGRGAVFFSLVSRNLADRFR